MFEFANLLKLIPMLGGFFKALGQGLKDLLIFRQGEKNQQLNDTSAEVKDAQEANQINSGIGQLPDSDLDKLL